MMKRVVAIGLGLGGAAVALLAVTSLTRAADHRDAPDVQVAANIAADINDVYTWMTEDASKLNLAMTVFPAADKNAQFSDAVQYVFHVNSSKGFGMAQTETLIMCTFAADQTVQCWAGDEYVTGDASAEKGLTSESGALKVFAGLRDDPFFFNLDGFNAAAALVQNAGAIPDEDPADGCPDVPPEVAGTIVGQLGAAPDSQDPETATDFFAGLNTLAIVVQVDKELVSGGGPILAVWGSTNAAQ
jgi:Domain of unknown function (DUF4331)